MVARTLFKVLRAGSGTAARYSATVWIFFDLVFSDFVLLGEADFFIKQFYRTAKWLPSRRVVLGHERSQAMLLLLVECDAHVLLALRIGSGAGTRHPQMSELFSPELPQQALPQRRTYNADDQGCGEQHGGSRRGLLAPNTHRGDSAIAQIHPE